MDMLPILRTISVGGVFLAIAILSLALIPPGRSRLQFADSEIPARGVLIDRGTHPEWRQFLILAALRRANELDQLRALPGASSDAAPALPTPPAGDRIAGLPVLGSEAAPDDETGSINVAPSATMPIDIGETSSFELPVTPAEEKPPVAKAPAVGAMGSQDIAPAPAAIAKPDVTSVPPAPVTALASQEHAKPVVVIRKRSVRKMPAIAATAAQAQAEMPVPPPFNILQAIFASLSGKQDAPGAAQSRLATKPATIRRQRLTSKQTANDRSIAQ